MKSMTEAARFKCPTCSKGGAWPARFAPFCSERCKLIDLGKWLNQEHVIPTPLRAEHFEQFSEPPAGPELDSTRED
jgi:endogenous inhibitor of DNA gyrase (YacG/DUF329 family)